MCQVFKSLQIKGGGGVTAVGSTSDVEQCLLESSHNDGWTHKQRYRSKVPSVVTTRVRPCQTVLEEDTDALNDSVHWCVCVWGGECRQSRGNPQNPRGTKRNGRNNRA